jgi:hypothetical protein
VGTGRDGKVRNRVAAHSLTAQQPTTRSLADRLISRPAGADVAFVTCGGTFDPKARQSEDNTVVFASVGR